MVTPNARTHCASRSDLKQRLGCAELRERATIVRLGEALIGEDTQKLLDARYAAGK